MRETNDRRVMRTQEDTGKTFDLGNRRVTFYVDTVRDDKINQVCDSLYPFGNYKIPYHYHSRGSVTYIILKGSVELIVNGKSCMCEAGDTINIPAHCPYGMTVIDEGSLIREVYTNFDMLAVYLDAGQQKTEGFSCEHRQETKRTFEETHHWFALTEPAGSERVDKNRLPQISTEQRAIYQYSGWPGIECRLKVGRWDLNRSKEIWEYRIERNYQLQYFVPGPNERIYSVKTGKVMVEIEEKIFFAQAGDIIYIPAYRTFAVTAVEENTVLYDLNVSSRLFRMLEMLELAQRDEVENTRDEAWMKELLKLNDSILTGFVKTDFITEKGA